ncbi:amino acid kinase family protein [Derxia lacustris]|uniref:amino acid kinase family protein n=1 Tax=Derxia lacustris TaxID=764842 RepID=UPI00111C1252|nr:protein kinase [Derxia lacustris]
MKPITVVKLGGSLCRDAASSMLPGWLDRLARLAAADARRRWVIVPGGGSFADAVRDAQAHWRFDDLSAHNMAVLAMEQTARLMAGLPRASAGPQTEAAPQAATAEPQAARLAVAPDCAAIAAAWADGRLPIWCGRDALRERPDALTRWEVSADSLAAWLAGQLGADRLALVKHGIATALAEPAASAHQLAQRLSTAGIVDAALPAHVAAAGLALALWPAEAPASAGAPAQTEREA